MSNKGFKIEFEKEGEKPAAFESQKILNILNKIQQKLKPLPNFFIYKMV